MSEILQLRAAADAARQSGNLSELLDLTEKLIALGDEGDPVGAHANRVGAIYLAQDKCLPALKHLRRAHHLVEKGTSLHAKVLNHLALAYAEIEASHDVLHVVEEYMAHFDQFPAEGQALLGRVLQHKAAAYEVLDPAEAPKWYEEAASVSDGVIRQWALVDGAWADLEVRRVDQAIAKLAMIDPEKLDSLGLFAYLSVGAFICFAKGDMGEAERLRSEALRTSETLDPGKMRVPISRRRALLILLGGEIALVARDLRRAEAAGSEAAAVFRRERQPHLYGRAQKFLFRVVQARLA